MFLTLALFVGFAMTTNAKEIVVNGCGPTASAISSSCWSGCVSYTAPLTGNIAVDMQNPGPRKLTQAEYQLAQSALDAHCASGGSKPISPSNNEQ